MPTQVTLAQLMIDSRDRADMLPQNYVPTAPSSGGNVVIITTNYTAVAGDVILADASGGPITITIPSALANPSGTIEIKKIDATANVVSVVRVGLDLIDGLTIQNLVAQYDAIKLRSDGIVNWYVF